MPLSRLQLVYYAIVFSCMQDASTLLKMIMDVTGLKQEAIAIKAGVSQATVSRMLRVAPKRRSEPQALLCKYIHDEAAVLMAKEKGREVMEAFARIWDGTDEHASAVVKIINALDGLRPSGKKE